MFLRSFMNRSKPERRPRLSVEALEPRITPTAPAGNDLIWRAYPSASALSLHSNTGVNPVIYLDFDGHTTAGTPWNTNNNSDNPFTVPAWSMDANRAAFSSIEQDKIIHIWRQVAEDFAPFDIDVTTQDPGVARLVQTGPGDLQYGMRVVISPDPAGFVSGTPNPWVTGSIGVALLNSFGSATDTPTFIWDGDLSPTPEFSMADTISHEVGHTFGLGHDGTGPGTYYPGHGAGVTSWGSIMGSPFGINLTQWSRDSYPGADNNEDDLAIITTGHGFGYRPDDYGNTLATAKAMNGAVQGTLNTTYGIIERNTDVDFLSFNADPGPINITIDPLFVGPNLDISASLYSPSGALISTSNPLANINATFAMNVTAKGLYKIRVSGTGLAGPTGYPNYGSLGNYRATGTVTPFTPLVSAFRRLNPIRWTYNRAGRFYDGYITIANVTNLSFTGTFNFVLTLPHTSVRVLSPSGVQTGRTFKLTYTGTIAPNIPLKLYIRLYNPLNKVLATGYNTFVTGLTFTA